jgi:hypothetical protein
VAIQIGLNGPIFHLAKDFICKHSPYFAAMFEGSFIEGIENAAMIPEIDGVLSVSSFKASIQWFYRGRVVLGAPGEAPLSPSQAIAQTVEFTRLADMVGIPGLGDGLAEYIKNTIINAANKWLIESPPQCHSGPCSIPCLNLGHDLFHCGIRERLGLVALAIKREHVISSSQPPLNHPVREVIVSAALEGALRLKKPQLWKEIEKIPNFAFDMLKAMKAALSDTVAYTGPNGQVDFPFYLDSITNTWIQIERFA